MTQRNAVNRASVQRLAIVVMSLLIACRSEQKTPVLATAPRGALVPLMIQHGGASCGRSDRTYATPFWRPPYTHCESAIGDTTESAEIDADSVVVELVNNWTVAPASHAGLFSQAESELTSTFGIPTRCGASKMEWRQGNSLDLVLQIAPVSAVGTEFDEGPWRMTRIARLGPLDPAISAC